MHLGFTKDSLSKLIEYEVQYSGGFNSEFAESKNGTMQHGFIFLLDDNDKAKVRNSISPFVTNAGLFALLDTTSLKNRLKSVEEKIELLPTQELSRPSDFEGLGRAIRRYAVETLDEIESKTYSFASIRNRITNLQSVATEWGIDVDAVRRESIALSQKVSKKFEAVYLSQLSQKLIELHQNVQIHGSEKDTVKDFAIVDEAEIAKYSDEDIQSRIDTLKSIADSWGIDTLAIEAATAESARSDHDFSVTYLSRLSQVLLERI